MMDFLQRKQETAVSINGNTAQERMASVFQKMVQLQIEMIQKPTKKFFAQQAYEMFWPEAQEAIMTLTDAQVSEVVETMHEVMARVTSIIADGLDEAKVVGGGLLEEAGNHHSE
jgi:N-acetylglutamate synthase/N-acetylornithine aminotransferase